MNANHFIIKLLPRKISQLSQLLKGNASRLQKQHPKKRSPPEYMHMESISGFSLKARS